MRILLISHGSTHPGSWDKLHALGRCCYSQDVIMNQIVDFYGQVLGSYATA